MSLEKQQVVVLADRVNDLLDDFAGGDGADDVAAEVEDNAPLDTPIEDEFRVGTMSLGVGRRAGRSSSWSATTATTPSSSTTTATP